MEVLFKHSLHLSLLSNVFAGTHTIEIQDANGCSDLVTIDVAATNRYCCRQLLQCHLVIMMMVKLQ